MQVVEKSNEGLSRVLEVVVPAKDLSERLEAKIKEIGPRLKLKGFRPGKVPTAHVKRMYGKDLMSEIVQETLSQTSQKALDDAKIRPASSPDVTLNADYDKVIEGEADLSYQMAIEVMPEFEPVDAKTLELKRPTYAPADEDVEAALKEILAQSRTYEAKGGKAPKAADGDMVVIDFIGRIDGEAFEGGTANDAQLVLGSGQFIPGFEDQLKGAKAGDSKTVAVTFPAEYGVAALAGKPAEFEVTVKEVKAPKDAEADDEFAKRIGLDSLDALKDALKAQLESQYQQASRFKLKRHLLDALDSTHAFDLPAKMVQTEFDAIWRQVEADRNRGALPPEDAEKSEEDLKTEYRKIAERRVRLGLVLAEIGRRNNVTVTDQELSNAVMAEARRYPGQEKDVFEFYRRTPNAAAQLRAPIFEEKVCDWLFENAKIEDQAVTKEQLFEEEEFNV